MAQYDDRSLRPRHILLGWLLIGLLLAAPAPLQAQSSQPPEHPFILPFRDPPGPDTWLLGQTYGNTVGAYFNRATTYR